ncbi:MAG: hypothetical protein V3T05_13330, partial [Myxococcota bacterium]
MASLAACGGNASVGIAVCTPAISSASGLTADVGASGEMVLDDGTSTLTISSAELVLRELEFERADHAEDCDSGSSDDSCEAFETGPLLVMLPLDGSVETQIEADVPVGSYDEIEFDIHKVSDDSGAERDFLEAHPEIGRNSIRVLGDFNGIAFTFFSDLNEEQEIELLTPLNVVGGETVSVTLSVDIATWFVNGSGDLINPSTANDGMPNEGLVTNNIRSSIEGF